MRILKAILLFPIRLVLLPVRLLLLVVVLEKKQYEELTDIQKETIMRIKGEPLNMQVDD